MAGQRAKETSLRGETTAPTGCGVRSGAIVAEVMVCSRRPGVGRVGQGVGVSKRRCGTCRFFQEAGLAGSGWCHHPQRKTTSDLLIMVRRNELACRDQWARDLWQSEAGGGRLDDADAAAKRARGPLPPASPHEIAAVVQAGESPDRPSVAASRTPPVVAEDVVLSEGRVAFEPRPNRSWHWAGEPEPARERPREPGLEAEAQSETEPGLASPVREVDTKAAIKKAREAYRDRNRRSAARAESEAVEGGGAGSGVEPTVEIEHGAVDAEPTAAAAPVIDRQGEGFEASPPTGLREVVRWRVGDDVRPFVAQAGDGGETDEDAAAGLEGPVSVVGDQQDAPGDSRALGRSGFEPSGAWDVDRDGAIAAWAEEGSLPFDGDAASAPEMGAVAVDAEPWPEVAPRPSVAQERPSGRSRWRWDSAAARAPERETGVGAERSGRGTPSGDGEWIDAEPVAEREPWPIGDESRWDTSEAETAEATPIDALLNVAAMAEAPAWSSALPRQCRTCRDFRPAEGGERGWCANQWAFTHRRMVAASDATPCESSVGDWWLPVDEVWVDGVDVSAHGQPTPLLDAFLPHHREEPLRERRRS